MFHDARIHAAALSAGALAVLAVASPALAAQGSAAPTGAPSGGASLTPTTTGLPSSGAPTASSGSTAGSGSTTGSGSSGSTGSNPLVQQGHVPVSGSSAGITLSTTSSAILRKGLNFAGTAPTADAGQTLVIERLGHETNWTWQPTVQTTVNSQGQFSATWSTNHIGEFAMRAVLANGSSQTALRSSTTSTTAATSTTSTGATAPMVTITIYRPSIATWYGPGFFGQQTACGEKLTRHTLGVANKTLKCGEQVALYYKGKTLVVPVIDRGPYANNADWDLTEATSKALGIEDTVTLGAVSLPTPPASLAIS